MGVICFNVRDSDSIVCDLYVKYGVDNSDWKTKVKSVVNIELSNSSRYILFEDLTNLFGKHTYDSMDPNTMIFTNVLLCSVIELMEYLVIIDERVSKDSEHPTRNYANDLTCATYDKNGNITAGFSNGDIMTLDVKNDVMTKSHMSDKDNGYIMDMCYLPDGRLTTLVMSRSEDPMRVPKLIQSVEFFNDPQNANDKVSVHLNNPSYRIQVDDKCIVVEETSGNNTRIQLSCKDTSKSSTIHGQNSEALKLFRRRYESSNEENNIWVQITNVKKPKRYPILSVDSVGWEQHNQSFEMDFNNSEYEDDDDDEYSSDYEYYEYNNNDDEDEDEDEEDEDEEDEDEDWTENDPYYNYE